MPATVVIGSTAHRLCFPHIRPTLFDNASALPLRVRRDKSPRRDFPTQAIALEAV
jgi:hypothetical protein